MFSLILDNFMLSTMKRTCWKSLSRAIYRIYLLRLQRADDILSSKSFVSSSKTILSVSSLSLRRHIFWFKSRLWRISQNVTSSFLFRNRNNYTRYLRAMTSAVEINEQSKFWSRAVEKTRRQLQCIFFMNSFNCWSCQRKIDHKRCLKIWQRIDKEESIVISFVVLLCRATSSFIVDIWSQRLIFRFRRERLIIIVRYIENIIEVWLDRSCRVEHELVVDEFINLHILSNHKQYSISIVDEIFCESIDALEYHDVLDSVISKTIATINHHIARHEK